MWPQACISPAPGSCFFLASCWGPDVAVMISVQPWALALVTWHLGQSLFSALGSYGHNRMETLALRTGSGMMRLMQLSAATTCDCVTWPCRLPSFVLERGAIFSGRVSWALEVVASVVSHYPLQPAEFVCSIRTGNKRQGFEGEAGKRWPANCYRCLSF